MYLDAFASDNKRIDLPFDSKISHECEDFVLEVIICIVVSDVILLSATRAGCFCLLMFLSVFVRIFPRATLLPIFNSKEVKYGWIEFGTSWNEVPLGVEMAACVTA